MLRPSVETERLSTVQRAARHVLDKVSRGESGFGSMEVFPSDVPRALSGSTEYIWRAQLAWAWWKAAYLSCRILGRGVGKHRNYTLLPAGREALERIASDPVLASFYVKAKRNTASESYPSDWFRPEALRAPPPKEEDAEEQDAEEEDAEEEDAEDETSVGGQEEQGPASEDREKDRSTGIEVERERRWDLMIGVLEKVSTQFGDLKTEITSLKAEVKAQSDFVLEVAQRIEASSRSSVTSVPSVTREDLGRVSAEIVQAIVSEKTKLLHVGANFLESIRSVHSKLDEEEQRRQAWGEKLLASVGGIGSEVAVLAKRGKSHEELEVFISGRIQQLADDLRGDQEDLLEAAAETFDKRLGALDKRVATAVAKTPDLSGFKEDLAGLREDFSGVREDFSSVREDVEALLESIDEFDKGFISRLEEYKKQGSATNETFVRVTEGVQDILRATRAVCSAMVEVSVQRSAAAGASPEEIRRRAEGAIDTLETASKAIKGRVSSLGAGIIKNTAFDVDDGDSDGDKGAEEEES